MDIKQLTKRNRWGLSADEQVDLCQAAQANELVGLRKRDVLRLTSFTSAHERS